MGTDTMRTRTVRSPFWALTAFLLLISPSAFAQDTKPKVAILVYDGVQVIDHAIPFEVFGQFSLNEVYTVGKTTEPLTTYMGMRIVPTYSFGDAPAPDVLVLPGGDAGDAQNDPEIRAWIEQTASSADHVLTVCTGIFFLAGNDLLDGSRVTTWYDRQDDLRQAHPEAHVIGDEIVVESGKLVSAAGLGIEGSLRVLANLHGPAWAEVVRLNMEYEPIPDSLRTPRVELADLMLPDRVYAVFPWREAELRHFGGDRREWVMAWRYEQATSLDSLRSAFLEALRGEQEWTLTDEAVSGPTWTSRWCIQGNETEQGRGKVTLSMQQRRIDLEVHVWSLDSGCEDEKR